MEKSTANLLKVIEKGVLSDAVADRLMQLDEQKAALDEAIKAEHVRAALFEDEHSIKAYSTSSCGRTSTTRRPETR
ncbi:hypothetical protein [Agathobaculum desmolans]|uniref:hypothetical protein n=1 Tax=Agathobaculum desmolans TaxID=39484 RepID=UPI0004E183E3|nr:hypothetical protein [Agathobaculum desmolans]